MEERVEPYDKVVAMYQSGARLVDITRETGVPRPTIYWALRQRGITPSRTKAASTEEITVHQVLEQLAVANREVGRLQARVEQLEEQAKRRPKSV
jgi:hypothetical protein